jgi:hypothetical protein
MERSSALNELSSYIEENESLNSTVTPLQCTGEQLELKEFLIPRNSTSNTDPDEFIRRLKQAGASRRRQFQLLRLKMDQEFDSDMTEAMSCTDHNVHCTPPPPPPDGIPPENISNSNYIKDFRSDTSFQLC